MMSSEPRAADDARRVQAEAGADGVPQAGGAAIRVAVGSRAATAAAARRAPGGGPKAPSLEESLITRPVPGSLETPGL